MSDFTSRVSYFYKYTVEPGISKLFQNHKKFTNARSLLSKGFDQPSNMSIIAVLKSSQIKLEMPTDYSGVQYWVWIVPWLHKITWLKENFFSNKTFDSFLTILFTKHTKSFKIYLTLLSGEFYELLLRFGIVSINQTISNCKKASIL